MNLAPRSFWRTLFSWCLYDWASAPFPVVVTTFIFSTYFTTQIAVDQISGTFQWANATALAGIIIAILGPLIGAIADYGGHHKKWLFFFTYLCIASTALLWFAYPQHVYIYYVLTCVILGTIGLEVALVFYNAYLPYIAPKNYIGRISGIGWGAGYLGGILALSIVLIIFTKARWIGLGDQAASIRISGPFVALWYAIFSLPLFLSIPSPSKNSLPLSYALSKGTKELISTLKKLRYEKNIFLYLLAHMIYTDGLNTLFAFGGIYAAGTYGLSFEQVLWFGMSMNVTAGIGAILLAWVDDYLGSKTTILISLVFLIFLGIPLVLLEDKYWFWGGALLLCLFVGPVQSASRSLMTHLIVTQDKSTEMFGLYSLSGKITAFLGPALLGIMTRFYHNQRAGMATVIIFFILGAVLLLPVKLTQEEIST